MRFGVSSGDGASGSYADTIEGSEVVLDGSWRHVAAIRDAAEGSLAIVVDGEEDFRGSAGISVADLSYPDAGVPVTGDCDGGQRTPYGWHLVVAAEKHDAGEAFPSFAGFIDELRIWSVARTPAEIDADRFRVLGPSTPGLVGAYRFEEGAGTAVGDSSGAGSPDGELRSGLPGDGEWVARANDPANTAPIGGAIFADGFESGDLSRW